jgi:hypothetical protein
MSNFTKIEEKTNNDGIMNQDLEIALKFLEKTKNGDFIEIEDSTLDYSRINNETIEIEENYFISIS